jgi:thiol:disulfide interchange protein DsbD
MSFCRQIIGIIFPLLLAQSPLLQAQEEELLPPEEAFSLSAWVEGDTLVAEYQIAPGYYMYRERFDFQIESSDAPTRFDVAVIPAGKVKEDEFFGKMETYRDNVKIRLPLLFDGPAASQLQVKMTSQGCADIGVCYPPLKQALAVDLASNARIIPGAWVASSAPAESTGDDVAALQALLAEVSTNLENKQQSSNAEKSSSADALAVLQTLGDDLGLDDDDEILHPDQAFILSAKLDANNIIQTNILLADHIYLYRDKIQIALVNGDGHALGAISVPRGKKKNDEFLGPTEVIYDQVNVSIPLISEANASNKLVLSYKYQGCVEERICYPPITKYLAIDAGEGLIQVVNEITDSGSMSMAASDTAAGATQVAMSEQDQFALLLKDESLLLIVSLFFLAGIGLTFTPCVFPMIPILSSIIAGQGSTITTRKAFSLSLIYVLSMAATYAVAGAIVGYYGAEFNIQIWFQDPVILSIFATVFVLLSLSMFGFYELQMPNAIQSRLTAISNSQQGGTLVGVGLMGLFSAIIVGPCITAPLVGALIFISQTQDWQLGGLALFALGLGMGVPLLLIGTSAGKLLPRAGGWMDSVKAVFGVVLLGVAIWLLERILPVNVTMLLIAALLIASAIYMGALDALSDTATGWRRLSKSLGLLILI